jgi:hypothetical protein
VSIFFRVYAHRPAKHVQLAVMSEDPEVPADEEIQGAVRSLQEILDLKREKERWMDRLQEVDTELQSVVDARAGALPSLSFGSFLQSTKAGLATGLLRQQISAAEVDAVPRVVAMTPAGGAAVRCVALQTTPPPNLRLKGPLSPHQSISAPSDKTPLLPAPSCTTLVTDTAASCLPRTQPLMVVVGEVDYRKLRTEQEELNKRTTASDHRYKALLRTFDALNIATDHRLSRALEEPLLFSPSDNAVPASDRNSARNDAAS